MTLPEKKRMYFSNCIKMSTLLFPFKLFFFLIFFESKLNFILHHSGKTVFFKTSDHHIKKPWKFMEMFKCRTIKQLKNFTLDFKWIIQILIVCNEESPKELQCWGLVFRKGGYCEWLSRKCQQKHGRKCCS